MRLSFQRPFNRLEPPQDKQLLPIDRPCLRYKPKSSTTTESHYHHRKMAIKSQSRSVTPELSGHIAAARGHLQPSVPTINFIDPRSTDLGDRHQPQSLKMPSLGPPNLPLHHPPKWVCQACLCLSCPRPHLIAQRSDRNQIDPDRDRKFELHPQSAHNLDWNWHITHHPQNTAREEKSKDASRVAKRVSKSSLPCARTWLE